MQLNKFVEKQVIFEYGIELCLCGYEKRRGDVFVNIKLAVGEYSRWLYILLHVQHYLIIKHCNSYVCSLLLQHNNS